MAGFEGRVRAVSEARSRPVTALESTRIGLFAVLSKPLSGWHGFLSRQGTIANFMMRDALKDRSRALWAAGFY